MNCSIVFSPAKDGYSAVCSDLDIFTEGETLGEAFKNIIDNAPIAHEVEKYLQSPKKRFSSSDAVPEELVAKLSIPTLA